MSFWESYLMSPRTLAQTVLEAWFIIGTTLFIKVIYWGLTDPRAKSLPWKQISPFVYLWPIIWPMMIVDNFKKRKQLLRDLRGGR